MNNLSISENKTITIGLSFYNAELYLKYAIDSILLQTYSNWNLILIDDGSTDRSMEIATSYKDERITLLSDNINKGFQNRLNQLIDLSTGFYFARMDADDVMHPDRLKKQVQFMDCHPEVDLIGTWAYSISGSNEITGMLTRPKVPDSIEDVFSNNCFIHPTVMGKTEWFKKNKYDENAVRMEDFELWLRTINNSNFYNLNEPLLFYREVGIPSIEKYMKTHSGLRRLVMKKFTFKTIIPFFIKSYLKCSIYYMFDFFGCVDALIRKRSIPLNEKDINSGRQILNSLINQTQSSIL